MLFKKTVAAICYSIARARCEPQAGELARRHPDLVRFLIDQQSRMPDYLRVPFRAAVLLFDVAGLVHGGRLFHAQSHDRRWRQIEAWRTAPLSPFRDFIRFYESLIVYHWYSDSERGA